MGIILERVCSSIDLIREDLEPIFIERQDNSFVSLLRITDSAYTALVRIMSYLSLQRQLSVVVLERVDEQTDIPYLDIEPELIWVYPDIDVSNDVLSNLNWNID